MKQVLFKLISIVTSFTLVSCQTQAPIAERTTSPPPTSEAKPTLVTNSAPSNFDEALYLFANPDVAALIKQGKYTSGLDHYTKVGQSTNKPDGESYESFFTGTSGNDTVTGFGQGTHTHLIGVKFEVIAKPNVKIPLRPQSIGQGESDILIGTKTGKNEFVVGSFMTELNPKAEIFYVGKGDADRAEIKNFTKSRDTIVLAGTPDRYKFEPVAGNLKISTKAGDLVAIVEGVDKLTPGDISKEMGIFILK